MSFSERVQELNQEIGATVERAVSDLRRQLTERLRASSEQILRQVEEMAPSLPAHFLAHEHVAPFADEAQANGRLAAFSQLRNGLIAIDRAGSQAEVLTALLVAAGGFASRAAILLLRSGAVQGWGAYGFGDDAAVHGLAFDLPPNGAWGQLAHGQGAVRLSAAECADLCSRLESPLPQDGVLVPLVLRDQLAAALYADRVDGGDLALEALQTLTYVAAQAIELLPLRERASTATLHLSEGDAGPAPAATEEAPGAAAATPVETAPPAVEIPEPPAPPAAPEPEPEPEPHGQAGTATTSEMRWPAHEEAVGAGDTELEELPETLEMLPEMPAEPAWEEEPEEELAPLPFAEEAAAPRPEETVLLQRPSFEPPPAPEPEETPAPAAESSYPGHLRPVAPIPPITAEPERTSAPAAPAANPPGTPEVRPPSDVEGPGWAFATTRVPVSPDDADLHESARRLARLLVSEIKLYNEDQVEEGRRNRDLYERLKEDIDRSRQMYEERVEPRVWKSTDYFYQELVRILAAGDSRVLGI
ncbi:MAG TPA: hypothetical protein VFE33_05425 [Thermoanaerobaculia bacterium]|nr:hypothetical protein [Thermoanaerobaculia bacterium]